MCKRVQAGVSTIDQSHLMLVIVRLQYADAADRDNPAIRQMARQAGQAGLGSHCRPFAQGIHGHMGRSQGIGDGLIELREHFGAGLRIYATRKGQQVVIMLAGGSKHGQQADIDSARKLIQQLKG